MIKTLEEKLQMCKEHVDEGKSILHVCELHQTKNKDDFKYYINLYKRYGEKPFINRENAVYRRDTIISNKQSKKWRIIKTSKFGFGINKL